MNNKSLKGAYLLVGAKGLSSVIGLASMLILARLLSPEDYGLVVLVDAAVTLLAAVTELQMASVLIHLPKVDDVHFSTAWTLNLIRAFVLCGLVILIAPGLALFYEEPRLLDIAYVSSVSLFVGALLNPKMAIPIRDLDFKKEFILGVSQKVLGFVVTVAVAYQLRNYWALVLGTLATQLCALVVSYWCYPFRPSFTLSRVKDLWTYSVWLTLSNFVKTLNVKLDQFVVGKMFSTETTGVYSLGTRLSTVLFTDTLGAALRVISPSMRQHVDDLQRLRGSYLHTQSLVCLVFLPLACVISAISGPLIWLALGPNWVEVTNVFRLLVIAFCLEAVGGVGLSVVMATLNTRLAFYRDLASIVTRTLLMLIGLYLDGFLGLLVGRTLSSLLDLVFYQAIAARVTQLSVLTQLLSNWRTLTACLLVYPLLYMLPTPAWASQEASSMWQALWLLMLICLGLSAHGLVQAVLWWCSGCPHSTERAMFIYFKPSKIRQHT
ncbi:MAG TPA: lipopolysaccharide biosynthesis protein [Limnobacter sp.]|nr:lipopolysaccharide biosynthesis protein [Limnobacter sp.]